MSNRNPEEINVFELQHEVVLTRREATVIYKELSENEIDLYKKKLTRYTPIEMPPVPKIESLPVIDIDKQKLSPAVSLDNIENKIKSITKCLEFVRGAT